MPHVELRPLTVEERAVLRSLAAGRKERLLALWFGAVVAVAVYVPGSFVLERAGVSGRAGRWCLLGLALVAGGVCLARLRRLGARFEATHGDDLRDGRAEVTTFEATDAVRVEELEDEGSSYFLRLADGGVLYLSGQYLQEDEERGRFPATRFRTVRAARSGHLLDLEVLGEPLAVSATQAPFTVERHEAGEVPDDGEVLGLEFEELRGSAAEEATTARAQPHSRPRP